MGDVNCVILTGRLVRDAEIKQTSSGIIICEFAIANNYTKKSDDEWKKEANFFDLAIFGKTASSLYPYLKQGVLVGIDAEIRQDRWEQDGKKRMSNEIRVQQVHLLSSQVKKQDVVKTGGDSFETDESSDLVDGTPSDIF
jgi:single stranded DNA-binding protein (ssb)